MRNVTCCLNGGRQKQARRALPSFAIPLAASLLLIATSAMGADPLDKEIKLDIPPNTLLGDALIEWGTESGMQVMVATNSVAQQTTDGVRGTVPAGTALLALLQESGLSYSAEGNTVTVVPVAKVEREVQDDLETPVDKTSMRGSTRNAFDENPESVPESDGDLPYQTTAEPDNDHRQSLEEVVVTAQKRKERLIDVPQSVTVLSSDALAKLSATQFRDFASAVPGLSFMTSGAGSTQLTLRGVTTGFDITPTVAVYVDDVPYGPSTPFMASQLALDVGLFDLERIEVLRGPQGTLYGASTMGGLVKYVTKRADAAELGGNVQAGVADTRDGSTSYSAAAAVNIPIVSNKMAIRMSGFESYDGGYIDNVALDQNDVNRSDVYGGRLDLQFRATEALTIQIGGFLQNISRDGESTVDYQLAGVPQYGPLEQFRNYTEPFNQSFRLVSGTLIYDLRWAALTSISSYQTLRSESFFDISQVYVPLLASFGLQYSALGYVQDNSADKFTQEIRLTSQGDGALEWLIGGFYTHESAGSKQRFVPRDLSDQPAPNTLFTYFTPLDYDEYAAFGDLTYHFNSKVDLSGGIRYARNDQSYTQFGSGLFGLSAPISRSSEHVFTYLANARYHFSDYATGYLRYATGYRPGGPNVVTFDATTGLPLGSPTFDADRLKSYEVGFKGATADQRFGLEVAGYLIDWSDIQVSVVIGGFGAIANATGGARVKGSELTLTARPTRALTFTSAFAYQDAYLRQAEPSLGGAAGERLPNVPRFTAALSGDYEFAGSSLRPTIGVTLRHVSDRTASFDDSSKPQYDLPEYTTLDLRSGLTLDSTLIQLYVHNVSDERGQLSDMLPQFGARIGILQPRTIGLMATMTF